MATAKRTTAILRNSQRRQASPITPLAALNLLIGGAIATNCGASLLFPTKGRIFSHHDTINITYYSDLARPTLSCWCGVPGRATQKFSVENVNSFNGSISVPINFSSDDPCWFDLSSETGDCRSVSETFLLFPRQHPASETSDTVRGAPAQHRISTLPLLVRTPTPETPQQLEARNDSFNVGAKAALGIGIALICIAIGAMAAFFYWRRRRRGQDGDLSSAILDHDRRRGRKGKKTWGGSSSEASGRSDEPLCPIQPVFDGYPGSMGYDDVRSLHSTLHSHSPTGAQSPANSHNGFWTYERSIEREELTAARLKSQLQPSTPAVVSYGPNPVTPTLTPRVAPHVNVNTASTPISASTTDLSRIPMMPLSGYSDYTDYHNFSIAPPAPAVIPSSEPKLAPPPIVVSYGPNKVTPTPLVTSPTVPPDESIVNRRLQNHSPPHHHERQFSFEADSPLLGASIHPLPPYASTEDFEAMEKGAVRKLAEPQAEAELPPTKDGFYHYMSDSVEYELPGAAVQREPQLPFRPYQAGVGAQGSGGLGVGRAGREIDEQKFLLDDVEIARLREEKARVKAKMKPEEEVKLGREGEGYGEGESYDLGERR
ncbi:hypothetical protein VTI74DRAFT_2900 [Chaetomium olivicolor]